MALGGNQDDIEIRIKVDNTGAVTLLGQTEEKIKGVQNSAEDAAESTESLFKTLAIGAGTLLGSLASLKVALAAIDRGSRVDDIATSFNRLAEAAGFSADEIQNRLSNALGGLFTSTEVARAANELFVAGLNPDKFDEIAQAARSLAEVTGGDLNQALDTVSQSLLRGNDRALKALGVNVDLTEAYADFARQVGLTADELNEAGQLEAARIAILRELEFQTQRLGLVQNDAADNVQVLRTRLEEFGDQVSEAIATNPELNRLLEELATIVKEIDFTLIANALSQVISLVIKASEVFSIFNPIIDTTSSVLDYMADRMQEVLQAHIDLIQWVGGTAQSIVGLGEDVKQTNKVLDQTLGIYEERIKKQKEEKAVVDAMIKMYGGPVPNAYKKTATATKSTEKSTEELIKDLERLDKLTLSNLDAQIRNINQQIDNLDKEIEDIDRAKQEARDQTFGGGFMDSLFGTEGSSGEALNNIGQQMGETLLNSINEGLTLALNGESLRPFFDNLAQDLGEQGGRALGESIGGPIGGEIGSAIGSFLGDKLGDVISSIGEDSPGTKARKALDKMFSEAFKDLQFSGNQDPSKGPFAGLTEQAQAQFSTLGDAIAQSLGVGIDSGVNLGVVLANNNISLSEMEYILGELGLSFEQLADQMYQAFYQGEISVVELQDKLEELYGIASGYEVFNDLGDAARAALSAEGGALLGALKGIGKEAEQLGVNTLPQLANILVSKFGLAAEQVNQIIASMSAAGVKAVTDLANASNNTLVAVGANLSQVQNGQTPNNTPVPTGTSTPTPRASTGGGSRSSSGRSAQSAAQKAAQEREKQTREIIRFLEQAQNSSKGRQLEDAVRSGVISDGQYAEQIKLLADSAKVATKKLDDAEKRYSEAVLKKSKDQKKYLDELLKAQKDLDDLLGGSGSKGASINEGFYKFAQEFAGNVDLINKAAKAAGLSFKDMKESAIDAFLSGSKSAIEARKAIQDAGPGIAGKTGAVGEQFEKLLGLGTNGGLFSIEALKGLAAEAREAGATTLDNLTEGLLGQGANRESVQKLFIALNNAGVTTLDALESVSNDTAINILAIMQEIGAPFKETSSEIKRIADQIVNIPSSKKIEIQIDGSISPQLLELLKRFEIVGDDFNISPIASPSYSDTSPGVKEKTRKKVKNTRVDKGVYRDSKGALTRNAYSYI